MNILRTLFLFSCVLFMACEDDDSPAPAPDPVIDFGSITLTDANGALLGGNDNTDWQLNASFSEQEQTLFGSLPSTPACTDLATAQMFPAYPNPVIDVFSLYLRGMADYTLALRVVDKNYQLLKSFPDIDNVDNSDFTIHLDVSDLPTAQDTVRLYYQLYFDDCTMSGHGDLLLQ